MHQDVKDKHWYPAKIIQLCPQPRSYIIETQKGARMQRTTANAQTIQAEKEYQSSRANGLVMNCLA